MPHPGFALRHRVLPVAKAGKDFADEMIARRLGSGASGGKHPWLEVAEMVRKTLGHESDHVLRQRVRRW